MAALMNSPVSPFSKSAVALPPPASQIRGRAGALKFNYKPNQLSMKSQTQMKPMAISSSSSSNNNLRSHDNDYRRALLMFQDPPLEWIFYFGVAIWTLVSEFLNFLRGVKSKILVLSVIIQDEDGLLCDFFEYIHDEVDCDKDTLDVSVDYLLEKADSCLCSASLVCSNYLQMMDNFYKLYDEDFDLEACAEDDINCSQTQICLSTTEEISDVNIRTIQDFKAFLRKLGSIEGERIVSCKLVNFYEVKGPIQRHKAYNSYSHLHVQV